MGALAEFLERLRADPNKHLEREFEEFLADFFSKKEKPQKEKNLQTFLLESEEEQSKIIQQFLENSSRLQEKYAIDMAPIYEMGLDDFKQRLEFGDGPSKQKFEAFLKSWEGEDDTPSDVSDFAQLNRTDQEEIFARFREEELADIRPKKRKDDDIDFSYDGRGGHSVQYNRDEQLFGGVDGQKHTVLDQIKEEGATFDRRTGLSYDTSQKDVKFVMDSTGSEPNRLGDDMEEDTGYSGDFR